MVSHVAGLAIFSPRVLGLFLGFEMRHRLQVWPFLVLWFLGFHSNFQFCRVFEVIQSMQLTEIEKPAFKCLKRGAESQ